MTGLGHHLLRRAGPGLEHARIHPVGLLEDSHNKRHNVPIHSLPGCKRNSTEEEQVSRHRERSRTFNNSIPFSPVSSLTAKNSKKAESIPFSPVSSLTAKNSKKAELAFDAVAAAKACGAVLPIVNDSAAKKAELSFHQTPSLSAALGKQSSKNMEVSPEAHGSLASRRKQKHLTMDLSDIRNRPQASTNEAPRSPDGSRSPHEVKTPKSGKESRSSDGSRSPHEGKTPKSVYLNLGRPDQLANSEHRSPRLAKSPIPSLRSTSSANDEPLSAASAGESPWTPRKARKATTAPAAAHHDDGHESQLSHHKKRHGGAAPGEIDVAACLRTVSEMDKSVTEELQDLSKELEVTSRMMAQSLPADSTSEVGKEATDFDSAFVQLPARGSKCGTSISSSSSDFAALGSIVHHHHSDESQHPTDESQQHSTKLSQQSSVESAPTDAAQSRSSVDFHLPEVPSSPTVPASGSKQWSSRWSCTQKKVCSLIAVKRGTDRSPRVAPGSAEHCGTESHGPAGFASGPGHTPRKTNRTGHHDSKQAGHAAESQHSTRSSQDMTFAVTDSDGSIRVAHRRSAEELDDELYKVLENWTGKEEIRQIDSGDPTNDAQLAVSQAHHCKDDTTRTLEQMDNLFLHESEDSNKEKRRDSKTSTTSTLKSSFMSSMGSNLSRVRKKLQAVKNQYLKSSVAHDVQEVLARDMMALELKVASGEVDREFERSLKASKLRNSRESFSSEVSFHHHSESDFSDDDSWG